LRYNTFIETGNRDIILNNIGSALPGIIAEFQGGFGNPADNCFSSSTKAIAANSTVPFTYFVRENYQQAMDCSTLLPVNNNLSNYTVLFTNDNGLPDCNNETLPVLPTHDKPELVQARDVLTQAEANAQARPGNLEFYAAYLHARDNKNSILRSLLIEDLDAQNYTGAVTLLAEEGTPEAQQWLLSVKLIAKDFTGAQQVWNTLPTATQDEQWFRDIMEVNLQRLQNMGTYALSPAQETTLYTIANSDSPYRSYARALLALLKDERFPLDEPETPLSELPQAQQPAFEQVQEAIFSVAPNPASEAVEVRYPVSQQHALPKQLWLMNLSGGVSMKQINLDDSGLYRLATRELTSGVYLLRITDKTSVLYQAKLIVLP
ncbi:MAG: T9SS type A sorting domain-containing protein, partial [Saprospiraceae bacterium]|nr:T9SS type A sorting domain-containing protein [Saprospiraceae bacterium]